MLIRIYLKVISSFTLANILYAVYNGLKNLKKAKLKTGRADNLRHSRTSDTLVLFGCGDSINDIDDELFDKLQNYDTAALSYAVTLPIKFTFYFLETASQSTIEKLHIEKLLPVIQRLKGEGSLEKIIWKNAEDTESKIADHLPQHERLVSSWLLTRNEKVLGRAIRLAKALKLPASFMMQCAGSVFAIAFWAHQVGYKRVILAGIDLNGSKYFFVDNPRYDHLCLPNPLDLETRAVDSAKHATNDPAIGMPMSTALHILKQETHVELISLSEKSALAEFLPVFR